MFSTNMTDFSLRLSPPHNPLLWTFIHGAVAIYSFLLLILAANATEDKEYVVVAQTGYIIYDFVTTVIWCTAIGSTIACGGWDASTLLHRVELALAVIFLLDSAHVLYVWKFKDEDVEFVFLITLLQTFAYAYECFEAFRTYREQKGYDGINKEGSSRFDLVV
mmetsp:Transcript_20162/g.29925  ORF Transcript_20162/g.29925 Transcript_20162/m.29925 type:complete len:163 (+) Transcript_20162:96-584(+)